MMSPQLVYAVSEDGTEAAFSATLVPTFDAPAAATQSEEVEVLDDEKPEDEHLGGSGSDFHFFLIVDRSASMAFSKRMELSKEAMELFVRSLPFDCKFSILSYGSQWEAMKYEESDTMTLNDTTRDFALAQIK